MLQQSLNGTTQKSDALTANSYFGRPAQSNCSPGSKRDAMTLAASSTPSWLIELITFDQLL